ncbi:MAG: hypothetical protein CR217_19330 [Beijerinckiaceae bacterium]|nr:MAG: hypothetical protein CR217_19330 [Beijerinckiaceae bacterium]
MTNADPIVIAAAARTPIGGFQGERQPEDAADGRPSSRPRRFPSRATAATISLRSTGRGSAPEQPHARSRPLQPAQQPAPANPSIRVLSFPTCLRIKHHISGANNRAFSATPYWVRY